MKTLAITRRTFLKAAAATGVVAAVFHSGTGALKGLAAAKESAAGGGEVQVLKSACRSCSHSACEVLVHVKDGKVVKIEPDPEGHWSIMCSKGQAAIQQLYNPTRIKYPMKRVGARGEGKWQRISWDEALDTLANKLQETKEKYGPESIFWAHGTGRHPDIVPESRFRNNFGGAINRLHPGHVCHQCREAINKLTVGLSISHGDFDNTNCAVYPGTGFFHDPSEQKIFIDTVMRTKSIVVDPVFRDFSSKAKIWMQVRPGTDCAWALAWLNVIIGEDLYEHDWVKQWTNGPFLVVIDPKKPLHGGGEVPGPLLTEADMKEEGNPTRYMVWDEATKSLKYWDATSDVFKWEAPGIKPALFGTYTVTLKDGRKVECKPAWQILWDRVEHWTPEKAAEITWIPADKIREAARTYATTKPAYMNFAVANDMQVTMTQSARILCFLQAMTGNIQAKGGDWFDMGGVPGYISERSLPPVGKGLTPQEKLKRLAAGEYPLLGHPSVGPDYTSPRVLAKGLTTGKPYKPKALLVFTTTLMCYASQKPFWKAMEEWDFVSCQDLFMTPAAHLLADIVFPTSHWLEDNNLDAKAYRIRVRQRAVGPLWECLSDDMFYSMLGRKLGLGELYPWETEEEFWNECVKPTGVTFEELKKIGEIPGSPPVYKKYEKGINRRDKKPGFETPTGKVEIYSTILKGLGYDPLYIHYIEPFESPYSTPELARKYPLVLTTGGRSWHSHHSEQRQVAWLREIQPAPYMHINPETAKGLGIEDGDWVWIENQRGRIRQQAVLYEGIHPRVVMAQHLWWYPEKPATKENPYGMWDSNINVLTDSEQSCAVGAGEALRGLLCKVYKAVEGAPEGVWTKPEQFKPWLPKPPGGE